MLLDLAPLTTGDKFVTRSLIWCVGVRADPLVEGLDLGTYRGRLDVDPFLKAPGAQDIWACGDCAAVPDLTRPGQVCGMTAQHAQRQGKLVARNVAASLGHGTSKETTKIGPGSLSVCADLCQREPIPRSRQPTTPSTSDRAAH